MQIELQAADYILRTWLAEPHRPRRLYAGVSWLQDHPEADSPLSAEEVEQYKRFLRTGAPSAYAQLFHDDA